MKALCSIPPTPGRFSIKSRFLENQPLAIPSSRPPLDCSVTKLRFRFSRSEDWLERRTSGKRRFTNTILAREFINDAAVHPVPDLPALQSLAT